MTEAKRDERDNGTIVPVIKCGFCGGESRSNKPLKDDNLRLWGVELVIVACDGWMVGKDFHICRECLGVMKEMIQLRRRRTTSTGEVRVDDPLNV